MRFWLLESFFLWCFIVHQNRFSIRFFIIVVDKSWECGLCFWLLKVYSLGQRLTFHWLNSKSAYGFILWAGARGRKSRGSRISTRIDCWVETIFDYEILRSMIRVKRLHLFLLLVPAFQRFNWPSDFLSRVSRHWSRFRGSRFWLISRSSIATPVDLFSLTSVSEMCRWVKFIIKRPYADVPYLNRVVNHILPEENRSRNNNHQNQQKREKCHQKNCQVCQTRLGFWDLGNLKLGQQGWKFFLFQLGLVRYVDIYLKF